MTDVVCTIKELDCFTVQTVQLFTEPTPIFTRFLSSKVNKFWKVSLTVQNMVKISVGFPKIYLLEVRSDLITVSAPVLPPLPQLLAVLLARHLLRQHLLFPLLAAAQQSGINVLLTWWRNQRSGEGARQRCGLGAGLPLQIPSPARFTFLPYWIFWFGVASTMWS